MKISEFNASYTVTNMIIDLINGISRIISSIQYKLVKLIMYRIESMNVEYQPLAKEYLLFHKKSITDEPNAYKLNLYHSPMVFCFICR